MHKLLLSFCLALVSMASFAQVTISMDTSFSVYDRETSAKPIITITNNGSTTLTYNWNTEVSSCIIPTGYTMQGVCALPGQCWPYNSNVHTETIAPGASQVIEPSLYLEANARLDSACIIVVNTDLNGGKKLTFVINAQEWPLNTNNYTKANKINLEMYPMPAVTRLNVVHNNPKVARAYVFNMVGKKVAEYFTPANASGFSIPVTELSSGMYIIDVRDANNFSLATQRFSKN